MTRKKRKQAFKKYSDSIASVNGGKNTTYSTKRKKYVKTKK